jgi:uncharacterized protein (DUF1778 family)
MPGGINNDARLNCRLPTDFKAVVEKAATSLDQSVNDFAVTTLIQTARSVLAQACDRTEVAVRMGHYAN